MGQAHARADSLFSLRRAMLWDLSATGKSDSKESECARGGDRLKANALKRIITNVSHDIKTPLTSIITIRPHLQEETENKKIAEYAPFSFASRNGSKTSWKILWKLQASTGNKESCWPPARSGCF
jgi:signal transduction histidine kinase